MKIRLDHVTNSSSSGFIVALHKEEQESFEEYINELDKHEDAQNEGCRIYMIATTMDELNEYTNGRPFDWASKACGLNFENLNKEHYNLCKEVVEEGGIAIQCWIDWNVCEQFDDDYSDQVIESFD